MKNSVDSPRSFNVPEQAVVKRQAKNAGNKISRDNQS